MTSHYRQVHSLTYCATCGEHFSCHHLKVDHKCQEYPEDRAKARSNTCTRCDKICSENSRRSRLHDDFDREERRFPDIPPPRSAPSSTWTPEYHRGVVDIDAEIRQCEEAIQDIDAKLEREDAIKRSQERADDARAAAEKAKLRAEILRMKIKTREEEARRREEEFNAHRRERSTAGRYRDEHPRYQANENYRDERTRHEFQNDSRSSGPYFNYWSPPSSTQEQEAEREPVQNKPPDHYAILGISPTATTAEILKAAKKMRIETHPDRLSGRNLSPAQEAERLEKSKNVGLAADILSEPATKRKYDEEVEDWKAEHGPKGFEPNSGFQYGSYPTRTPKAKYESKFDVPPRSAFNPDRHRPTPQPYGRREVSPSGQHAQHTRRKYVPEETERGRPR